jgi:transcription initiation factor TFIIIB Brf1 subunit/transcription initiation factor TFIIB
VFLSQETAVLGALKAAVAVQNPSAEAWKLLGMFYEAVGEVRAAKEAAFKWLRQAQRGGWHEDEEQAAVVAQCCSFLARCADY